VGGAPPAAGVKAQTAAGGLWVRPVRTRAGAFQRERGVKLSLRTGFESEVIAFAFL